MLLERLERPPEDYCNTASSAVLSPRLEFGIGYRRYSWALMGINRYGQDSVGGEASDTFQWKQDALAKIRFCSGKITEQYRRSLVI